MSSDDRVTPESAEAFRQIGDNGALGALQAQVHDALLQHGPKTGAELNRLLGGSGFHKRLSELGRLGVAAVVEVRACKVTGRNAASWSATSPQTKEAREQAAERQVRAKKLTPTREQAALILRTIDQSISSAPAESLESWIALKRWLTAVAGDPTAK